MAMQVERARPADLPAIRAAYADARAKQRATGSPLWPDFTDSAILAQMSAGTLHRVVDGDAFVGVFTSIDNDGEIWGELERGAHIYLHRIARSSSYQGRGLVDIVIAWALARAEALGREGLRMDTWAINDKLRDYYGKRGFTLVEVRSIAADSPLPANYRDNSFALLERPLEGKTEVR
jgi:ribosomal protein S18 acetylase RimI-like enzyme